MRDILVTIIHRLGLIIVLLLQANSRIDMCGMLAEKQQFQVKLQQAKAQMAQIRVDVEANDKLVAELEQVFWEGIK